MRQNFEMGAALLPQLRHFRLRYWAIDGIGWRKMADGVKK